MNKKLLSPVLLLLFLGAALFAGYTFFKDSKEPEIILSPDGGNISGTLPITLRVSDEQSNIQRVEVALVYDNKRIVVVDEKPLEPRPIEHIVFNLQNLLPKTGEVSLEISAVDTARFGFGNTARVFKKFFIDSVPPQLQLTGSSANIRRGGSAVVAYKVDKPVRQTGVTVGDLFFPGFMQNGDTFVSFYAFPYSLEAKDFSPQLVAVDIAGNVSSVPLNVNKIDRNFKQDRLSISQNFLDKKAEEFQKIAPKELSPLEHFLYINSTVREENTKELLLIGRRTVGDILWNKSFLALPRGAVKASFAEYRTYFWDDKPVSESVHLGYDLASVSNAAIPAANDGIVVFADYLGIFGNMVVIDHGLGLQSLYSHLSEIAVHEGQKVSRGESIGKTGTSGLALGDHLHFGVLMSGLEVSPLEWLDARWIDHNIILPMKEAGIESPLVASFHESSKESFTEKLQGDGQGRSKKSSFTAKKREEDKSFASRKKKSLEKKSSTKAKKSSTDNTAQKDKKASTSGKSKSGKTKSSSEGKAQTSGKAKKSSEKGKDSPKKTKSSSKTTKKSSENKR